MNHNAPDELLRAYLKGTLAQAEKKALEDRLAEDDGLAQALDLERAEMAAAELLIAAETRQYFAEWATDRRRTALQIRPLLGLVGLAASLLLLFAAIQWLYQPPQQQAGATPPQPAPQPLPSVEPLPPPDRLPSHSTRPPEKLPDYLSLARQQLPAPLLTNLRQNSADSSLSSFEQAQLAFSKGYFQQTLDLLDHTDSTRRQATTFLEAHALFQLGRYAEAELRFAQLVRQNSRQFRFQSEWAVLMCRLANYTQQPASARQQLDAILAQPQHPYFEKAQALQKILR